MTDTLPTDTGPTVKELTAWISEHIGTTIYWISEAVTTLCQSWTLIKHGTTQVNSHDLLGWTLAAASPWDPYPTAEEAATKLLGTYTITPREARE